MSRKSFILSAQDSSRLRARLLGWFAREKRQLPWRGERDPYRILVSEVMLQQTRVAVVEQRYRQFLRRFPTISRLARAREQTVLAAWSGLGYYRRARSLHAAAKQVFRAGKFPRSAAELLQLPGIGRYTANAVASIAFDEPVAVVDGNVKRVLARLCGRDLRDEEYWQTATALLRRKRPGDFNQALMELGAMVCLPQRPVCSECPVKIFCASRGASPKNRQMPRKKDVLKYVLARHNRSVLLVQRPSSSSLMPGMWELPAIQNGRETRCVPLMQLRHSITTTDYSVFVFPGCLKHLPGARWFAIAEASRLPLTGVTRKILHRLRAESGYS